MIIPYTPNDEIAKIYKTPKVISANIACWLNGITAQPNKLIKKVIPGEKIKITLFALLGTIISFTINFNPSDNGCNNPKTPITLGPLRR